MVSGAAVGGMLFLLLILVIAAVGWTILGSSDDEPKKELKNNDSEQKSLIQRLEQNYRNSPTFVNQYIWYEVCEEQSSRNDQSKEICDTDNLLIKYVQNHKGRDGKGDTIIQAMSAIFAFTVIANNEPDILNHPGTSYGWRIGYLGSDSKYDNFEKVIFELDTYDDYWYPAFLVNTKTGHIVPDNAEAREILDIVDTT